MTNKKHVYMFSETDETMKNLVGGKGANLGQMTKLGLPIPQGFTVTTEVCTLYYANGGKLTPVVNAEIEAHLAQLEKLMGKEFGNPKNPLLVSVRSGARASMPGMMDTILNLGLNDEVVEGIIKLTNNPRFAYDSYRRFIQMYSDVVMGLSKAQFEVIIDEMKEERKIEHDVDFGAEDFKEMVKRFKAFYRQQLNEDFPNDPKTQLFASINAVFASWENPRANYYRRLNGIPSSWGTAVNVQAMVYGNMGETSGTGVAFTRNPATGENKVYGEFLMNAQGEDVVAGVRTPHPIDDLKDILPNVYYEFIKLAKSLEDHYRDMQDIEFTIEDEKLYLLQTRNGKRTAQAALKIAVDMFEEGMISKEQAVMLVDPNQLDNLLHPQFDAKAVKKAKVIGEGLPASPGAGTGKVVFNVAGAAKLVKQGHKVILVRLETSPEDIEGMHISEGFITARGGMTSHAAVVARGMGKSCVSGVKGLNIDEENEVFTLGGKTFHEGDSISIDGTLGTVYGEAVPTVAATISGDFKKFMGWCDEIKRLVVRTNADTPKDALQAKEFGAKGIGLCRTEHMFFEADRIKAVREFILADDLAGRERALAKLLPIQRKDFAGVLKAMAPYPVTVRYLDPPLHEFLPTAKADIEELALDMGVSVEKLTAKITSLHEFNPMMGHRGCRLSVSYPELAKMQTQALMEAYVQVKKEVKELADPEIMIPLVGEVKELTYIKDVVIKTADAIIKDSGLDIKYQVGTMIEIPRAALLSDEIALEADFFSFGTNDLTQMTFGFSRDDAGAFLDHYYEKRILEFDPFAKLDQHGVGKLVATSVKLGRAANPKLHLGVCGEHGGEPSSVEFFHNVGLDYVSCSPFRVPIARLAAAQAVVKQNK